MLVTLDRTGAPVGGHVEDEEEISMITIQHEHEGENGSDGISHHTDHQTLASAAAKTWPQRSDLVNPLDHHHPPTVVVVGVCRESSCRDAIRWAVAHQISGPSDSLVLLHVVSKISQSCIGGRRNGVRPADFMMVDEDVELFQSEVPPHALKHYIKGTVEPMLEELKATLPPQVRERVQVKVGKHNTLHRGILEEAKKLQANSLVLGTHAKGIFSLKAKASHVGTHCVKHRPNGMSVYVIRDDAVVLSENSQHSPPSSFCPSPGSSVGSPEPNLRSKGAARTKSPALQSTSAPFSPNSEHETSGDSAGATVRFFSLGDRAARKRAGLLHPVGGASPPDFGETRTRGVYQGPISAFPAPPDLGETRTSPAPLRHSASAVSLATMEDEMDGKVPGSNSPRVQVSPVFMGRSRTAPPTQAHSTAGGGRMDGTRNQVEDPSGSLPLPPKPRAHRAAHNKAEVQEEEARRELEALRIIIAKAELARLEAEICAKDVQVKLEAVGPRTRNL